MNGDATREYKTVSFSRGATFTVDRRMFLDGGMICVNALTGDRIVVTPEHGPSDDEGTPSSSDGDDESVVSSIVSLPEPPPVFDEPPAKRRKVNSGKYATDDHYCGLVGSWVQSGIEAMRVDLTVDICHKSRRIDGLFWVTSLVARQRLCLIIAADLATVLL